MDKQYVAIERSKGIAQEVYRSVSLDAVEAAAEAWSKSHPGQPVSLEIYLGQAHFKVLDTIVS